MTGRFFGRRLTKRELLARVGRLEQIARIESFRFDDGRAKDVRAIRVVNGGGLAFTIVTDRCLDVAHLEHRGTPLCWFSRNGIAAPTYYERPDSEFLRIFFGGLVTTCGLQSFGPAGSDRWGTWGLHGGVDALPAEDVRCETRWEEAAADAADDDDGVRCVFEISGTVRQTHVFGENMRLERRWRTVVGSRRLELHDRVTNDGGVAWPHMQLYHCNAGYPLLDDQPSPARVHASQSAMRPRDADAERGLAVWDRAGAPEPGFKEQVFVHTPRAVGTGRDPELAVVATANPNLNGGEGLALAVRFDPRQLPAFFTWRMLGTDTYVMGMEPANCPTVEGRIAAEKAGTLPMLQPGESVGYDLVFEVLEGRDELRELAASTASGG